MKTKIGERRAVSITFTKEDYERVYIAAHSKKKAVATHCRDVVLKALPKGSVVKS